MAQPQATKVSAIHLREDPWRCYLLECADTSLYCGVSNDVPSRIATHSKGKGARYTRKRLPIKIVWLSPPLGDKSAAMRVEWGVKRYPKAMKLGLIASSRGVLRNTLPYA